MNQYMMDAMQRSGEDYSQKQNMMSNQFTSDQMLANKHKQVYNSAVSAAKGRMNTLLGSDYAETAYYGLDFAKKAYKQFQAAKEQVSAGGSQLSAKAAGHPPMSSGMTNLLEPDDLAAAGLPKGEDDGDTLDALHELMQNRQTAQALDQTDALTHSSGMAVDGKMAPGDFDEEGSAHALDNLTGLRTLDTGDATPLTRTLNPDSDDLFAATNDLVRASGMTDDGKVLPGEFDEGAATTAIDKVTSNINSSQPVDPDAKPSPADPDAKPSPADPDAKPPVDAEADAGKSSGFGDTVGLAGLGFGIYEEATGSDSATTKAANIAGQVGLYAGVEAVAAINPVLGAAAGAVVGLGYLIDDLVTGKKREDQGPAPQAPAPPTMAFSSSAVLDSSAYRQPLGGVGQ